MLERSLNRFVFALEIAISIALVMIAGLLVITLGTQLYTIVTGGLVFGRPEFTRVVSTVLEVFIVIELFRIALAYMTHRNVLPTVLEATLIAIARKLVVFEPPPEYYLHTAIGLAALLIAIAGSWWMLSRSQVLCPTGSEER